MPKKTKRTKKSLKVIRKKTSHRKHASSLQTLVLLIAAVACMSFFVGYKFADLQRPSFKNSSELSKQEKVSTLSIPVAIDIASVHVKLPVEQSHIVNGYWEVSDKGASHLATSARPGGDSNVVVYGHNLDRLFGKIRNVKQGDTIIIKTQDNGFHYYTVTQTLIVNPTQIDVVLPTKGEVLTLFTCDGWADSQRFVVRAKPISSI